MVKIKPGVKFTTISPSGYVILEALKRTSKFLNIDLTITSACEGTHSGVDDPHYLGEAYDVRSKDLGDNKQLVLEHVRGLLDGNDFYSFIESPGTINEHFHIQRKKNTIFTIQDYLAD